MKIQQVNNEQIKVGDIVLVGNFYIDSDNNLCFKKHHKLSEKEYKCENGRVYFLTQSKEIIKIGGSSSKGGIKATIGSYLNGKKGQPGESRFAINILITEELNKKNKIELYMILCPETYVRINGLTTTGMIVSVNPFKEIENLCKEDYFKENQKYPKWNYKENNVSYPLNIKKAYSNYKSNAANK